jgi:hypothetical protein
MRAWLDDPDLKADAVTRMRAARDEGRLIPGTYRDSPRYAGCMIGILAPADTPSLGYSANWHNEIQRLFGIPADVVALLDATFETLPFGDPTGRGGFAVDAIEAIPVGADLSKIVPLAVYDYLTNPDHGPGAAGLNPLQRDALNQAAGLYQRLLADDPPTMAQWRDAKVQLETQRLYHVVDSALALWSLTLTTSNPPLVRPSALVCAVGHGTDHMRWLAAQIVHHLATAPIPPVSLENVQDEPDNQKV